MKNAVATKSEWKFNHKDAFEAFLSATNQKNDTAEIISLLINQLLKKLKITPLTRPVNIADFGCADGKTCALYLSKVTPPYGFNYTGIDILEQYLTDAKEFLSKQPKFKEISTLNCDIFNDHLSQKKFHLTALFDILLISHSAYYMRENEFDFFIKELVSWLNIPGFALFVHEKPSFRTCGYFRNKYNPVYSDDIPSALEASIIRQNIHLFEPITFNSQIRFGQIPETYWRCLENPLSFHRCFKSECFINFFNKLCFIVQRNLLEMHREATLSDFLKEIKETLELNQQCITITSYVQIILPLKSQHHSEVKQIMNSIQANLKF